MSAPATSEAMIRAAITAAGGPRELHDLLTPGERQALRYWWPAWARPCEPRVPPSWLRKEPRWGVWSGQMAPPGQWTIWLYMAGRASGKTITGSNWALEQMRQERSRGALLGATSGDARRTMVKGKSGVVSQAAPWRAPRWYHTDQTLTDPMSGGMATLYTADEPGRLNGPEHDWAWVDELCVHKSTDPMDQLRFTLRGAEHPRILITTTPARSAPILSLLEEDADDLAITIGATSENTALPEDFLRKLTRKYQGTVLGKSQLDGELVADIAGALWRAEQIEATRVQHDALPQMQRVVVAVDPASMTELSLQTGRTSASGDLCGIVVCGLGEDGHGYVLDDLSLRASPDQWARVAIKAYEAHHADRIVYETAHGGKSVEGVLRAVAPNVPITGVDAKRGKYARAEPVSALYERSQVHHVSKPDRSQHPVPWAHLSALEDQMCSWTPASRRSPDRMDAMVYALTELMLEQSGFCWPSE